MMSKEGFDAGVISFERPENCKGIQSVFFHFLLPVFLTERCLCGSQGRQEAAIRLT